MIWITLSRLRRRLKSTPKALSIKNKRKKAAMQNPSHIDKRDALSKHFLFRQLLPAEIDRILALAVEKHFENGQMIFVKDEEGDSMMIVLEGRIVISAISEEGKEITLNYIESGGILGEIALIDGKPRSANARAVGKCRLISIQRGNFIPFLRSNSDVAIQLLMVLCEKLRNTSSMLENLGLLLVPVRLAKFIIKLTGDPHNTVTTSCDITLKLSQQEIANLIGTTRETVNRIFSQWQTEGLILLQRQQLTVLKPKALRLISETQI
jgi:CRP/FNR family cyclic AMP-dependent transcriptional regulator